MFLQTCFVGYITNAFLLSVFFFRCPIESRRSGGREWGENNVTVAMISFHDILAFSSWI